MPVSGMKLLAVSDHSILVAKSQPYLETILRTLTLKWRQTSNYKCTQNGVVCYPVWSNINYFWDEIVSYKATVLY